MARDKSDIVRDVTGRMTRCRYKPVEDKALSKQQQADVWQSYFEALETYGEYGRAAKEIGYNPKEVIAYRRANPTFQEYCTVAVDNHRDALIGVAEKRATEGMPRYNLGGKERDTLFEIARDYSDPLLLVLLKRWDSSFSETQRVEVISDFNAVEMFDYASYSPRARAKLRELMVVLKEDKESADMTERELTE